MDTPLVVVARKFSRKEAWLGKVALMDIGIQLPNNHLIFRLFMRENAMQSFACSLYM